MGEAKRRKEKLGDDYWKGQSNSKGYGWKRGVSKDTEPEVLPQTQKDIDSFISLHSEQTQKGFIIAKHHIKESGLDKYPINQEDLAEAIRLNFFSELEGLERLQSGREGTFGWGRLKIFKAASLCLVEDSQLSLEEVRSITKQIHDAGEKMYEIEGMEGLKDPLIWLFMPQIWKRIIDSAFNGIGSWLS